MQLTSSRSLWSYNVDALYARRPVFNSASHCILARDVKFMLRKIAAESGPFVRSGFVRSCIYTGDFLAVAARVRGVDRNYASEFARNPALETFVGDVI